MRIASRRPTDGVHRLAPGEEVDAACVWRFPAKCLSWSTRPTDSRSSTLPGFAATSTSACSTTTTGAAEVGDWVLIHVGFAISKVDEEEAIATRRMLEGMGADYEAELEELKASVIE